MTLATEDLKCSVLTNGNVSCSRTLLVVDSTAIEITNTPTQSDNSQLSDEDMLIVNSDDETLSVNSGDSSGGSSILGSTCAHHDIHVLLLISTCLIWRRKSRSTDKF